MIGQAAFTLRGRNPDVLTCIANLSNDEVFTPPEFANRMLDRLAESCEKDNGGANLWADSYLQLSSGHRRNFCLRTTVVSDC